jgi:hypothetical protein
MVRAAADRVRDWLAGQVPDGKFPEDSARALELQEAAEHKLREILEEQGLYDGLIAAWRRHVVERSECHAQFLQTMGAMREQLLADLGGCDVRWEDIIEVCTSWSDDVVAHIAYHPPPRTGPETLAAVKAVIEAGLGLCLARLIERADDPGLAETVRSLTLATEGGVREGARRRAWDVWKAAGVGDWLDRTRDAGGVPDDVAAAIERCAEDGEP